MVFTNTIEAGNKVISNTGKIIMYGRQRSKMSRLRAPCPKGASSFTVETGLDWVAGDKLGLLPTSLAYWAGDEVTIQSYNSGSGLVTINQTLSQINHYHWGSTVASDPKYNNVDIRGEVVLLTRNIKIAG